MPPSAVVGIVVWNGCRTGLVGPYLVTPFVEPRPAPPTPPDDVLDQAQLRREVVRLLRERPRTGAELTAATGESPTDVHLAISALRSHDKVIVVDRVRTVTNRSGGRSWLNVYGLPTA